MIILSLNSPQKSRTNKTTDGARNDRIDGNATWFISKQFLIQFFQVIKKFQYNKTTTSVLESRKLIQVVIFFFLMILLKV